jgi:hypothetical protein
MWLHKHVQCMYVVIQTCSVYAREARVTWHVSYEEEDTCMCHMRRRIHACVI